MAALAIAARRAAAPPLRITDMLPILIAIVPGAIVGGRLVHALAYLDFYLARPSALLDPTVGSLSLLGAVLGGWLSAAYVARLLGDHLVRWSDAAAVPMLVVIGFGKLAMVLGGSGQGLPFDGPWAVAFTGDGPWVSANPGLPSHPSQVYEGLWLLAGLPLLAIVGGRRPHGSGRMFAFALCWFLAGRLLVGFTWRDMPVIGPLNVEQAAAVGVLLIVLVIAIARRRMRRRRELATRAYLDREQS